MKVSGWGYCVLTSFFLVGREWFARGTEISFGSGTRSGGVVGAVVAQTGLL